MKSANRILSRLRRPLLVLLVVSTIGWMVVVFDNYVVHIPYAWGRTCIPCYNYIYYIYDFAYFVAYPGFVAAVFFLVFLITLVLLWTPRRGLGTALLWTFLLIAPLCLFAFGIGAYFLLYGYWKIHATNFLAHTPFTNEVLFWTSGVVLSLGILLEFLRRVYVSRRRPSSPDAAAAAAGLSSPSSSSSS